MKESFDFVGECTDLLLFDELTDLKKEIRTGNKNSNTLRLEMLDSASSLALMISKFLELSESSLTRRSRFKLKSPFSALKCSIYETRES